MNRTKQKADYEGYVSHPQEHNGYFLDPANPEVSEFLLKLIDEITTRYKVDGVNIDYARYPNIAKENYNNQWGYTKFAREEFMQTYEIDPIEIEPDTRVVNLEYRTDLFKEDTINRLFEHFINTLNMVSEDSDILIKDIFYA